MSESNINKANRLMNVYFRMNSPQPYQSNTKGDAVYYRWSTYYVNPIFILTVLTTVDNTSSISETTVTTEFAIDVWSNRESANYSYYLNME